MMKTRSIVLPDRPSGLTVFNRIDLPEGLSQNQRRPFFNRAQGRKFEAKASQDVAEITLYDEIGFWGVNAKDFRQTLKGIDAKRIVLSINSPGGDVFDAIAMYNDLLDHPADVTVKVTGLAASAASVIAMAGDRIEVADNAFLMIHNAWTLAVGNKADIRATADVLGMIDGALADTYVARTGLPLDEIVAMMDAETWLGASEAVDKGFADGTFSASDGAKAAFDLSVFKNTPKGLQAGAGEWQPPETRRDVERMLMQDAGLTRSQARATMAALSKGTDPTQDAGDEGLIAALKRLRSVIP